ncbi:MAG TPA: hypothetical protein VGX48_13170 [Pyrinomonadaceae bacterium]|jgi:preprotein translocase subunit Sss1|nr:hypothetical protein [Pyrinomonadaceae bacterium]
MTSKPLLALALCCLLPLGALASDASSSEAQDSKSQAIVPMSSGAYVIIATETSTPAGATEAFGMSFVEAEDKPNLVHRVFVDKKNELFFGYELLVEPVSGSRVFRVSVRPLSAEYIQALKARPAFARRQLHPSYNAAAFPSQAQSVGDGSTFALDVLHNPRTGEKIVDLVTVTADDPRVQERPTTAEPARDFSLEDVRLSVFDYQLKINGETVFRSPGGGVAGSVVWFSAPGRGRFIFSLVPRPGYPFEKVGKIEHNRITFEWQGDRYEWVTGQSVVGLGGNWHVWVMHDPDYNLELAEQEPEAARSPYESIESRVRASRRPGSADYGARPEDRPKRAPRNRTRVVIGAANNMELLLPKK